MIEKPAISVQNLSKRYFINQVMPSKGRMRFGDLFNIPARFLKGEIFNQVHLEENELWALKDVSFEVVRGQRMGVIGKNGAGKTTLLKILSRLVYPTEGKAVIRGRTTALFGVGTGFKPKLTGRENIYHNAALHGLTKKEINDKFREIVDFSGLERFIETPVLYYSKGMYARLAFSVAAHLDPEILMLDEVLSGGDMAFQKKCLNKIEGIAESGRTILFVSHNMNAVISLCNSCIWIEDGRILESGVPKDVVKSYSKRMLKLQSSYRAQLTPENQNETSSAGVPDDRGAVGAVLMSLELTGEDGGTKELFRRDEPIIVNVTYRILRDDIDLIPVLHLFRHGEHVFSTHPVEIYRASKGSLCKATTTIPGNLLNTGEFDFSIAIVTPARPKWRHVYLENILSIKVVSEDSKNLIFSGEYRGVVRPNLPWVFTPAKFE
jgi:lipopolysaccharide transport system ATP-binding protein